MVRAALRTENPNQRLMFQNIVVAVDGSASAEQALMHAIDLSDSGDGRLTLFTAAVEPSALT
jgi:nucleotide-binding universal stress UspA family protein